MDAKGRVVELRCENESELELAEVLQEAFSIFSIRNAHHNDPWRSMDEDEEGLHVLHKAKRLANNGHEDDGLDLINYSAFAIINKRHRDGR